MKKINLSKPTLYLLALLFIAVAGSVSFFYLASKPAAPEDGINKTEVLGETVTASPSPFPSASESPLAKASIKPSVKPSPRPSTTPAPSIAPASLATPTPSASPAPAVLGATSATPSPNTGTAPSPSPSPSPSSTPITQTVNVEVQGSSFTVEISGDLNVCQVLEKAKDQGKIASLTLDNSYISSMNSLYVKEMNGLSNNWTFKVNGNSPLGCSLYQVKPEDLIVWKFG